MLYVVVVVVVLKMLSDVAFDVGAILAVIVIQNAVKIGNRDQT